MYPTNNKANLERIIGKKLHLSHRFKIKGTKNKRESGVLTTMELASWFIFLSGNSLHEFQKRPIGNCDRPNKGATGREGNCADWN